MCHCRLYIPDDIDYVEQDLEQLKGLFLADGQGLPAEDVDNLCAPVVDLLNVLQLETGILIKNFKDVRSQLCLYLRLVGLGCLQHYSSVSVLLLLCSASYTLTPSWWLVLSHTQAIVGRWHLGIGVQRCLCLSPGTRQFCKKGKSAPRSYKFALKLLQCSASSSDRNQP